MNAADIMTKAVTTVSPDTPVKELAGLMAEKGIGGVPVVGADGKLAGIVTESDLILTDARIRYPTYIHLLDGFIYWPGSVAKFNEDFKKALGATAGDIMTAEVVTAPEDATLEDLATLMADNEIGRIPIVGADGSLKGLVTKHDVVAAIGKAK